MYLDKSIAVVIPAYKEENQILGVLKTMPDFVDRIVVVNDCSPDNTLEVCRKYIQENDTTSNLEIRADTTISGKSPYLYAERIARLKNKKELSRFVPSEVIVSKPDSRFVLIDLKKNAGVGGAIARGYKWCKDNRMDVTAVMAGDGQMDPAELESIIKPVCEGRVDYVKGNRLIHQSAWIVIPKIRFLGNSILSIFTKIASGYWHISDTQCGYTAISLDALNSIRIYRIFKRYGMPNDLLVRLNIAFCKVGEVAIKPVYNVGENSKMKIWKVVPTISLLLLASFIKRLWVKYLFRDFHPLFLFYHFSFLLFLGAIPFIIQAIPDIFTHGITMSNSLMLTIFFLVISSIQSLFFALWMDMQDNERLYEI